MNVVRNGNTFTLIDQSGSNVISKGSGAIVNLYFTSGKKGLNLNSLKITEVKAANTKANKISVKIGTYSTSVKSGTSLS